MFLNSSAPLFSHKKACWDLHVFHRSRSEVFLVFFIDHVSACPQCLLLLWKKFLLLNWYNDVTWYFTSNSMFLTCDGQSEWQCIRCLWNMHVFISRAEEKLFFPFSQGLFLIMPNKSLCGLLMRGADSSHFCCGSEVVLRFYSACIAAPGDWWLCLECVSVTESVTFKMPLMHQSSICT